MVSRTILGRIHGRVIEFDDDLSSFEGQWVEVTVRDVASGRLPAGGEGLLRTEGALAEDEEWDAIMDEVHRARKLERRSEP